MSLTLEQYLKSIDACGRSIDNLGVVSVLRQMATELVELRRYAPIPMPATAVEGFDARIKALASTVGGLEKHATMIDSRVSAVQEYIGRLPINIAERLSDLQAQASANDGQHVKLAARFDHERDAARVVNGNICQRLDRLEQYGGFGEVPGRTLPRPLPKWKSVQVTRFANAVAVSGWPQGASIDYALQPENTYTFDDFEAAGRFVAAVLSQKPANPVSDYQVEERP